MAPDQRSLVAAGKLRKPAKWPVLGQEAGRGLLWGECQGSGSNPYRTIFDASDLGYKCTCPSRKFPCKHVLALGWQFAETPTRFTEANAPEWVDAWMSRRRPRATSTATEGAKDGDKKAVAKSALAADVAGRVEEAPLSPEEAARRAELAEQRAVAAREDRHRRILTGLDAFDRWALDVLGQGTAASLAALSTTARTVARRLVDAKAGGFAGRVDELPAVVFRQPERARAEALALEIGRLHLLAQAYRNLDALPPALAHDVRGLIGWSRKRDDLLEDTSAARVEGQWRVVGVRSVVQADQLRRVETWLAREVVGDAEGPAYALLLDYHPVSVGNVAPPFSFGDAFFAELIFYPSAVPLRAIIGRREGEVHRPSSPPSAGVPLRAAMDVFRERLAQQPWLNAWPIVVATAAMVADEDGQAWLTDGETSVPMSGTESGPLAGLRLDPVVGLWDGESFVPTGAYTDLGAWWPGLGDA